MMNSNPENSNLNISRGPSQNSYRGSDRLPLRFIAVLNAGIAVSDFMHGNYTSGLINTASSAFIWLGTRRMK